MSSAVDSSSSSSSSSQSQSHPHSSGREPSSTPIYSSSHVYTGCVALDEVEATKKYSPSIDSELEKAIPHPGLARADVACDKEHPSGSLKMDADGENKGPNASVLQQHVMFFDLNHDGIITPYETYCGFRKLDFNPLISLLAVCLIHGLMSYSTQDSWLPDPMFRLIIKNMHRGIHGSDSNVYDREGRFIPQSFEDLFSKFDHDGKGGLYWDELLEFLAWNRDAMDFVGILAARFEWGFTWLLAAERSSSGKKLLRKETIRQMFDGTLFENIARRLEAEKEQKRMELRKRASEKRVPVVVSVPATTSAGSGTTSRTGAGVTKKVQ